MATHFMTLPKYSKNTPIPPATKIELSAKQVQALLGPAAYLPKAETKAVVCSPGNSVLPHFVKVPEPPKPAKVSRLLHNKEFAAQVQAQCDLVTEQFRDAAKARMKVLGLAYKDVSKALGWKTEAQAHAALNARATKRNRNAGVGILTMVAISHALGMEFKLNITTLP